MLVLPAGQAVAVSDKEGKSAGRTGPAAPQAVKRLDAPRPKWVEQASQVRSLPGWLDDTVVLNSNSPEVISSDGILVSTFPPKGKKDASAHLNFRFNGRFDIFAHHIARPSGGDFRTMYLGLILQNQGAKPVTVSVKQAASYLEKPDAPFKQLPDYVANPVGRIYAGAGDRLTDVILRGASQSGWPKTLTLAPGQYRMLFVLPIPTRPWRGANCRSTLAKIHTTGSIYAASLAMKARLDSSGRERPPSLEEWQKLLNTGHLATPRDKAPTEPKSTEKLIYGRVSGVSRGTTWRSVITRDPTGRMRLNIPRAGMAYSYVFSTVEQGAFGTMNYQSAPLVVRYPDTAHKAHGNYGVRYELTLPLYNQTNESQNVTLTIQCPYKANRPHQDLNFREPPLPRVFYRGTVRLRYRDDQGVDRLKYVHLVLHQADASKPLVKLELAPKETRTVVVDLLYPPDSTPPQIITVKTTS